MRWWIVFWLLLLAVPGSAQEARLYQNEVFGFAVEVPQGLDPVEGDSAGQSFSMPNRAVVVRVWGERVRGAFDDAVARMQRSLAGEGWRLAEQATTPDWARFSVARGGRMQFYRLILLCDRQSYAAVQAEYSAHEQAEMDAVLNRLGRSLRAVGC